MSKKAPQKVVEPEPVKHEEPPHEEIQLQTTKIETEGYGRFEYPNGIIYEGQWKLINGFKMKHGEGVIMLGGSTSYEGGNEEYRGGWEEDKMSGYGVYKYTSGAIYYGEWKAGRHHGRGTYEFPDGTLYEGEFSNHKMNGEGYYIDKNGSRWEGEFVDGVFQSKIQKELKQQKLMNKKELDIKEKSLLFFTKFEEAFTKSDKKTFKENMIPFFGVQDDIKQQFKEPYPKYEERQPDKWNDSIKWVSEFTMCNVLRNIQMTKIVDPTNILVPQFNGIGQIIEFQRELENRCVKLAICNTSDDQWNIVFFHDSAEPEPKKK